MSHHTGAFVLGVDHFGKAVETGTRGSSAKEAAADTVLAMLATRMRLATSATRAWRCGRSAAPGPALRRLHPGRGGSRDRPVR